MKIPLSERAYLGRNSKLVIGRPTGNPLLRRRVPPIPSSAHWGWGHLPVSAKILFLGILCGLISLTTPFWVYVKTDVFGQATYGLWHFCRDEDCTSIRDNVVEGSNVPAWLHLVQGSMCIGVACSLIGLAIITNSIEGKILAMTVTVHHTCACVLGIAAVEQFVGLYVFVTYLEETDFLFDRQSVSYELDFYGSFYAAVVSFACSLLAALVVYMDESISKVHKECSVPNGNAEYMLPEELMLYAPYDWNVVDDREYDDDDDHDELVAQNDVDR